MNAHFTLDEQIIAIRNAGTTQRQIRAQLGCTLHRVRCALNPDYAGREVARRREYRERKALEQPALTPPPPPVARDWLAIGSKCHTLRIDAVKGATCEHFEISSLELCSDRRDATTIHRRHVAIYIACEDTGKSLPQIGAAFGGLDHTTILHARRKVAALIKAGDALVIADVEAIRRRVSERKGVVG